MKFRKENCFPNYFNFRIFSSLGICPFGNDLLYYFHSKILNSWECLSGWMITDSLFIFVSNSRLLLNFAPIVLWKPFSAWAVFFVLFCANVFKGIAPYFKSRRRKFDNFKIHFSKKNFFCHLSSKFSIFPFSPLSFSSELQFASAFTALLLVL